MIGTIVFLQTFRKCSCVSSMTVSQMSKRSNNPRVDSKWKKKLLWPPMLSRNEHLKENMLTCDMEYPVKKTNRKDLLLVGKAGAYLLGKRNDSKKEPGRSTIYSPSTKIYRNKDEKIYLIVA